MKKTMRILAVLWLLAAVPVPALAHDPGPASPEERVVAILGLFAILMAALVPLPKKRARRRKKKTQPTTPQEPCEPPE